MKTHNLLAGLLVSTMLISMLQPTTETKASELNDEVEVYVTAKGKYSDEKLDSLHFEKLNSAKGSSYVKVYPDRTRQEFIGVGGAITESAAYNINKLNPENRQKVYDAYFGKDGAEYSIIRSSIGSADFSTRSYSYNDTDYPDTELKNFSIAEDRKYIIPAIKTIQMYRPDIKFFAAPWAPPAWMKKSNERRGKTGTAAWGLVDNSLNPMYYESYANYFVKYIKAYEKEGIPVYSLSMQNESQNNPKWEACTWKPAEAAKFVGEYLGPALEANNINTKLLIWDWDKGNDPMHGDGFINYNTAVLSDKKARKYIDGIAFHWYAGDVWHEIAGVPMWSKDFYSLDEIRERFPNINLYATEACQEKGPWFGSFDPADRYIYDILNDFEHGVKSWVDWNLVLDRDGGPTQGVVNKCHAPIMLDEVNNVFFQPSYFILKRISKEVQPGDMSIETKSDMDIVKTAIKDSDGTISVLLGNVTDNEKTVNVIDGGKTVEVTLLPHSLTTLRYKDDGVDYLPGGDEEKNISVKPIAATATSYEKHPFYNYKAVSAIDDSLRTRWASDWKDNESITFELLKPSVITGIELKFENGEGSAYDIQTSKDGVNFTTVRRISYGEIKDKNVIISLSDSEGSFVRLQGIKRYNRYGYSIYDVNILVKS